MQALLNLRSADVITFNRKVPKDGKNVNYVYLFCHQGSKSNKNCQVLYAFAIFCCVVSHPVCVWRSEREEEGEEEKTCHMIIHILSNSVERQKLNQVKYCTMIFVSHMCECAQIKAFVVNLTYGLTHQTTNKKNHTINCKVRLRTEHMRNEKDVSFDVRVENWYLSGLVMEEVKEKERISLSGGPLSFDFHPLHSLVESMSHQNHFAPSKACPHVLLGG